MAARFSKDFIESLSESEKTRLICCFLYHNTPNDVDWDGAAAQMGSASKHSFKVSFSNTMKKIRDAANGEGGTALPVTPTTPKKGRKKRAADEDDVEGESPKKKKATPRKSKAKQSEVEAEEQVKAEPMDEEPEQAGEEAPVA